MDKLRRRGLELEGTITGEHGIGLKLRDMLVEEAGQEAVDMMRKVRRMLFGHGKVNDFANSTFLYRSSLRSILYVF